MSPEQLRPEAPSKASDIWAIGVVLHWLIYEKFPIETHDLMSFLNKLRASDMEVDTDFNVLQSIFKPKAERPTI